MTSSTRTTAWRRWICTTAAVGVALLWAAIASPAAQGADVLAPEAPTGIVVNQGPAWTADPHFDVWWNTPPGQETPIAVAHYELCPALPLGPCTSHQAFGADISELSLDLPHPGLFWLRVWLEDAAGNVDPDVTSPLVVLRFDDGIPPEAFLRHDGRWLDADSVMNPSFVVEIAAAADWPISGIRGYSITVDGTLPDGEVEVFADEDYERFRSEYAFEGLSEGVTAVRLRSVSNAGIPSEVIGTAEVRLDRSPPALQISGLPSDDLWHRGEIAVLIEAQDQPHLSGMAPAAPDMPADAGAHLAYELDESPVTRLRGDRAQVVVSTDGHHRLRYRAFDAAGNASVEEEAVFKIDGTAPVGSFRALDPADPRALRVNAADATSGLADGRIEYRRQGDGGFTPLATTRNGGVLSARLDDQGLAAGRYELRAVVTDVAGNEVVVDRWADGSSSAIAMPLRLKAKLTVAGTTNSGNCARSAKQRRGKGKAKTRRKRPARPKCRQSTSKTSLALAHGKRASSTGRLVTGQGAPIAGAPVVVEGQPRSSSGFNALGTARTDAQGRFKFAIPAGPSRTVRYRYDGTNTVKPAAAQLTTKVRAAARLKVNRRRLRNGQAVRFTGRLLGKPIPRAGKLVALQAKVGRGWRTFATPRANSKGVFKHRYRFTATTGLRRYAFRAVIAREAAYPYEKGVSPTVQVTVRGRR